MKVAINSISKPVVAGIPDMNMEEYLIYAARVSSTERVNNETAPKLMKYLIDHKHWSPFEMVHIGIEVQTGRDISAQILRHKSMSFQEFSQRYSVVEKIDDIELRYQADNNRQSSTDVVTDPDILKVKDDAVQYSLMAYNTLLDAGVARECARRVLPMASMTNIVIAGTLRSWIHFFEQRCSSHAQKEIQQIAYQARDLLSVHCPWLAEALEWNQSVGGWDEQV